MLEKTKVLLEHEGSRSRSQNPSIPLLSNWNDVVWISGNIFKKSQILCNWEERFVRITSRGICSYKEDDKWLRQTFFIPNKSIKFIETRFELHNGCFLIVKIRYDFLSSTEFAIPVANYLAEAEPENWLWNFYKLMMSGKAKSG